MAEEQKPTKSTEHLKGPNELTMEGALEQAKRAFALRNYELSIEHYATALELMHVKYVPDASGAFHLTKQYGDASPECADLYFAYGKALLENAIAQNSVLGKEKEETEVEEGEENKDVSNSGRIHFGEDAVPEEVETDETGGEKTIDLFAEALKEQHEEEEQKEGNEEAEGEPEDDFNAAWEVLEVARSLYEDRKDVGDDVKLKLADTYTALGDISLETEKLEQAATDYTSAVALKTDLLPVFSRQIAEVHYKLCIVYDLTSGRLAQAIEHARKAQASVQARLNEITTRLSELSKPNEAKTVEIEAPKSAAKVDLKGKGKATLMDLEPSLKTLTKSQLEAEVKDLRELLEEVSLKIEELKTSPDTLEGSAPDLAARELDRELNGAKGPSAAPQEIHDLTTAVRKKRKAPETTEASQAEKKAKLETGDDPQ